MNASKHNFLKLILVVLHLMWNHKNADKVVAEYLFAILVVHFHTTAQKPDLEVLHVKICDKEEVKYNYPPT